MQKRSRNAKLLDSEAHKSHFSNSLILRERLQGAVQGPEEFAEGVALGVKGLFGATVGGGAGAVSRIAGTLGKVFFIFTFCGFFLSP